MQRPGYITKHVCKAYYSIWYNIMIILSHHNIKIVFIISDCICFSSKWQVLWEVKSPCVILSISKVFGKLHRWCRSCTLYQGYLQFEWISWSLIDTRKWCIRHEDWESVLFTNWLPFKTSQGIRTTWVFPWVIVIVNSLFLLMIEEVISKLLNKKFSESWGHNYCL